MDKTEAERAELWERCRAQGDSGAREQLILHYAPLVRRVVGRMGIIASPSLDYQDMLSHGVAGLIEAIDRFEPQRGIAFETFASQRIRGSVLDALRILDHVSRSVRQRAGEIERAIAELRARTGQIPSDEEVAAYLGISYSSYWEVLDQANVAFLSLDSPFLDLDVGNENMLLGETLVDTSLGDMQTELEERDLRHELVQAIQELPEREQLVLSLYYYEELTVREVGEVLDLSPSRVSQLLARTIMTLRARLIYNVSPAQGGRRARVSVAA